MAIAAGWLEICSDGTFEVAAAGSVVVTAISPSSGVFGTLVKITGSNLGASGSAFVGGAKVLEQSRTDATIIGTIGQGQSAGTYDVVVFNSVDEATGILSNGFTITALSANTVRSKMRAAVKWGLEQLTTTNGYRTNVLRVYDPPVSYEKVQESPAVCLYWDDEVREDEHVTANRSLLDIDITCHMVVYLDKRNDRPLAQDKIIADVQQYFGTNFYIPGSDGNRTVFNCLYKGASVFGTDDNAPECGVVIDYQIWYRIALQDPTSMT